jgi:DNA-binding beta-propeller fold protein YncE
MTGAALCAVLAAALLAFGCGEAATTDDGPPPATASPLTAGGGGEGLTDVSSGGEGADGAGGEAVDRAEIERRLALPRFTYVAETDYRQSGASLTYQGALAIVDSASDTLAHRPRMGSQLESVAVSPDGRLVWVTDRDKPVVHVVDAETYNEVRTVRLKGVKAVKSGSFSATGKICYGDMQGCSSALACTPDGASVLVLTKAGLQVIDAATFAVTRTLPELKDGFDLVVSFDGARAYVATLDYNDRPDQSLLEWAELAVEGKGGGLALLDLASWQVVKRVKCGLIGGLAVDPDDSRVFASDHKLQSLRIVDPSTLDDLAVIDLRTDKARSFQPRGVGVLPDGSKVYVVCADTSVDSHVGGATRPEEYFCAVVDAAAQEVVKRIPLDAY